VCVCVCVCVMNDNISFLYCVLYEIFTYFISKEKIVTLCITLEFISENHRNFWLQRTIELWLRKRRGVCARVFGALLLFHFLSKQRFTFRYVLDILEPILLWYVTMHWWRHWGSCKRLHISKKLCCLLLMCWILNRSILFSFSLIHKLTQSFKCFHSWSSHLVLTVMWYSNVLFVVYVA
jgi:hypothetical protein